MKRLTLLLALIFLQAPSYNSQFIETKPSNDDTVLLEKSLLLFALQALETKAVNLDEPLARALGKAEIAAAAWKFDQAWAKRLLQEAYELTLPKEEERIRLRGKPVGAVPTLPSASDRARSDVRNRVLAIARRDKSFADKLARLGAEQLGKYEKHFRYARLATDAIGEGDKDAAGRFILQSIKADPTQITAGFVILDLAAQDRPAADRLIIQYIERLRTFPLSLANQSALRTYYILRQLVFPSPNGDRLHRQIPPASPVVIRAYVSYIVESIGQMEQREPGSAGRLRGFLLGVWLPLRQYAPELTGAFLELERISKRPGESASLPQVSSDEAFRIREEERVKKALDSGQPDELTIHFAISQGDFDKARKMLDKLADGPQKTDHTETVNMREAISLATKGDILEAQRLAERLNKAASILQVYPVIIGKCVVNKDQSCATVSVYQAIKQLKSADTLSPMPPAGIPSPVVATSRELDPVLSSLSKLAKAVAPVNEILALEVLDEMVLAANRSQIDTGQGRTGFDVDVFSMLASKNELRARQAAETLKDPLRQIVALATIYQWKAEELVKKIKTNQ